MIKAAILGYGTVGSGVYEVLCGCGDREPQCRMEVKYILDLREFPGLPHSHLFTKDYEEIVNDPQVQVIAEVMGGLHPAYEFTKRALSAGKHVVTSNKELVAAYGAELLEVARQNHVNYLFEASVGGGIPIIRPMTTCLAANDIREILGILNGTTNYILTQMIAHGKSFEDALAQAQQNGYAERNPDADILGFDACRKIAILASLACGKNVDSEKIPTEGITGITLKDVRFADRFGYAIKLIGSFRKIGESAAVSVAPTLIPKSNPLAGVEDVFNAILVRGDSVGDVMFYGKGAGKLPTASAVVADMIDCVRNIDRTKPICWVGSDSDFMMDPGELQCRRYVRMPSDETAKAAACKVFGALTFEEDGGECAFLTPTGKDGELCDQVRALPSFAEDGTCSLIRVL